jgi:uncharacterized protein (TIGR03067 family)
MRRLVPSLLFLLLATPAAALPPPSSSDVARLIEQLASDSYHEREAAQKKLEQKGEMALPALEAASKSDRDAEVRQRARRLVEVITRPIYAREQKKLHGTWRVVADQREGRQVSWQKKLNVEYAFDDQGVTQVFIHGDGGLTNSSKGIFRVCGNGAIDIQFGTSRISKAIYRLEGDTLVLCFHNAFGRRPERIETAKGTESVIWTLKRQIR